jgi:PAS domain S-box-containing protein
VVERMHEGALTLGEDQQILYSNRHLAELLGYADGELIGKPVASLVALGDTEILADLLDEGAELPASGELRFRRQDGSLMPGLVAAGPLILDQTPALLLIITDLTAQKHSEDLAASERFARSILEQATDAVIVCDADGRITKASLAAERLLDRALEGKLLVEAVPMEVALPAEAHLPGVRMSSSEVLELVLQQQSL